MEKSGHIIRWVRKNAWLLIALGAYAALNGYLVSVHEPWRDEALAWTIARDLSPLGIIRQMSVEGHPCLWYFLLLPLTRAGLPILSMCVLSCVLMVMATAIFLFKSPFPVWLRVLLIFTPLFTYMYPVISRSYALVFLFMICLAALEKKKWEKPWLYCLFLGLLVQTHVIMLGMAGIMSLVFLLQRIRRFYKEGMQSLIRRLLPLLLPLGSFFWLLVQFAHLQESASVEAVQLTFTELLQRMWMVLPYTMSMYMHIDGIKALCLAGVVLALCIYGMIRRHLFGETICFLGGIGAQLVIYSTVNGPTGQRALSWFLLFLWYLWVCLDRVEEMRRGDSDDRETEQAVLPGKVTAREKDREYLTEESCRPGECAAKQNTEQRKTVTNGGIKGFLCRNEFLLLSLPVLTVTVWLCGVRLYPYMIQDIHLPFSDAGEVSKAIEAVVPENGTVVMTDAATASSVAAYLTHKGIRIFCPQQNTYVTYTNWDSNWNRQMTQAEMLEVLAENGLSQEGFYIVIDSGNVVEDLQTEWWQLLYQTPGETVFHESFSLYYAPALE